MDDDEFVIIKEMLKKPGLIELSNGDLINPISVSHVGEPDKRKFWDGYPLDDEAKYFIRDGERIYLEGYNYQDIEEREDPKYINLPKVKLLK